jgi:hypothetical protein
MNKQISKSVLIFSIALFSVFAILSCGNKNMELIAKKWKLEKMEMPGQDSMIAKMDSMSRAMYDSMMKQMIEKSSFAFTKEGKFTVDMGFAKSEGTFKISDDGKSLTTKEMKDGKEGKEEIMTIVVLSNDKFVSTQKDPSGKLVTMTLVPAKD